MFDNSSSSRSSRRFQTIAVAALLAAFATVASAGTYVVTLHSGAKFESRYKPTVAGWDANKVMILAESGNWVALSRADIATVRSTSESRGLGFVINNSTIALGWAPNDNLTPEQQLVADDLAAREALFAPQQQNYSVGQFVEPNATQGIPSGLIGGSGTAGVLQGGYGSGMPVAVPLPSGGRGDGGGGGGLIRNPGE